MNISSFKSDFKVMRSENSWGRIIIALGLIAIIILSAASFRKKPVVVLTPPGLTAAAELHHNKAQAGIHSAWSLFLAETLGNVTPETATFVRETLEPLLGPKIYSEALKLLEKQIDSIKRDRISFSFEPREVIYDDKSGTTFIVGRHYTHQGIGNPNRVNRTYEFRWKFVNYMPQLIFLDTYEGAPRVKKEEQKD